MPVPVGTEPVEPVKKTDRIPNLALCAHGLGCLYSLFNRDCASLWSRVSKEDEWGSGGDSNGVIPAARVAKSSRSSTK